MYKGQVSFTPPMFYALAFLFLFTIGGLTGIFLGAVALDIHLHDTYFVVAHFHYVMQGGTIVAFLGGLHHWWPKSFGVMYNQTIANIAALGVFIGFNGTFFPQFLLGLRECLEDMQLMMSSLLNCIVIQHFGQEYLVSQFL